MIKKVLTRVMPLVALGVPFLAGATSGGGWSAGKNSAGSAGLPAGNISTIIANFMKWLLLILGAIAVIGFVISGILYLTSAGDDDRIERAKKGMIYSILGVIVGLVGYVIVIAVTSFLGGQSATF